MKKIFFTALFTIGLISSSYAFTIEDREDLELYNFCSRFPQNSQCKGLKLPVLLEDREGVLTKCELRWQAEKKRKNCKFIVNNNRLTIYLETGDRIALLENKQTTQEINITSENIIFFPRVRKYEWIFNIEAAKPILISNIDIFFKVKPNSETRNRSNRIRIYFPHEKNKNEELQQQKLLLSNFLYSQIKLNEDKQYILSQIEYLQSRNSSSEGNTNKKSEIEQLLNTKECVRCDLSGVDLTNADLQNANLEGANLQNAILTNTKLDEAYLLGANLKNTTLNKASLVAAELPYSSLTKANLQEADLSGANLQKVDLTNANLMRASLLSFANLKQANLRNANLQEARLRGIDLNGANLESANLKSAEISVEVISGDSGAWTYYFSLPSDLSQTNLIDANLSNAGLQETIFDRANLTNVDLSNANLTKAHLNKANLENAILSNSNLKLAQLDNANLANSNLTNANFDRAYLVNANLSNARLNNTRMTTINMNGINLSGVNINGADLKDSTLCQATMPDGSISKEGCE